MRTLTNAIEQRQGAAGVPLRRARAAPARRRSRGSSRSRSTASTARRATPDNTCHACVAISNGTSLDVIEMDAASQRGIDDIREIRDRVVLQPVEGRSKVYILDEAHQLTDAAWNALLKLIEEPPPHLLFVFCTTELQKVLPTVRSRCQTFVFQRPRLPDLDPQAAPDRRRRGDRRARRGARADRARRPRRLPRRRVDARPARRRRPAARSPCRTCCSCSARSRTRCSSGSATMVVDGDTAGALVFLEELSEQGQDLGRLVTDLLEHLRHLLLVQHMGEVPDTLPVTDETRERLREQANQLAAATVVRLIDLLARRGRRHAPGRRPAAAARARARQGDAARLRPLARVARLPARAARGRRRTAAPRAEPARRASHWFAEASQCRRRRRTPRGADPRVELEQLQEAWRRSILPAVEQRSIPIGGDARRGAPGGARGRHADARVPADGRVPPAARRGPEERRAPARRALRGDRAASSRSSFELGDDAARRRGTTTTPASEEDVLELMKSTFDARELDE